MNVRSVSAQVASLLDPHSIQAARFFLNGLASRTRGIDAVGHYKLPTDAYGKFDFTLAANYNDAAVTKVPTNSAGLSPMPTLFARQSILTLINGTPEYKVTASIDWSPGDFGASPQAFMAARFRRIPTDSTTTINCVKRKYVTCGCPPALLSVRCTRRQVTLSPLIRAARTALA